MCLLGWSSFWLTPIRFSLRKTKSNFVAWNQILLICCKSFVSVQKKGGEVGTLGSSSLPIFRGHATWFQTKNPIFFLVKIELVLLHLLISFRNERNIFLLLLFITFREHITVCTLIVLLCTNIYSCIYMCVRVDGKCLYSYVRIYVPATNQKLLFLLPLTYRISDRVYIRTLHTLFYILLYDIQIWRSEDRYNRLRTTYLKLLY